MANVTIVKSGMAGVDMLTNPLFLPEGRLAGSTNVQYNEGSIETRPGFRFHDLKLSGRFQGTAVYSPSRGMSHQPFADPYTAIVAVVDGKLTYNLVQGCDITDPVEVCGNASMAGSDINLYQAENYLIAQGNFCDTLWWDGAGCYTVSPGLGADEEAVQENLLQSDVEVRELAGANIECCYQKIEYCERVPIPEDEVEFDSHDTFIFSNHRNFLLNSAGIGIYTNGRIHQESHSGIYVSDILHKRGNRSTDDILLMEEQQSGSFGDPLSTNSRMGQLRAMEVLPSMNTANGEGELVAYYDNGVVSFNTHIAPRMSVINEESLEVVQRGWAETRQVNHLLNRVSAVGRYAVGLLPRDHAFRSRYGIHLLKTSLGEGTFNDEYTNTLSQDVQPILDSDMKSLLRGTTVGHWVGGSRLLVSTGMIHNELYSTSSMARGFVVWNQASTFTEDRTPRPLWDGLWVVGCDVAGIHRLMDVTEVNGDDMFGFVSSGCDGSLHFGEVDAGLRCDTYGGQPRPIEWDVTTRKVFKDFSEILKLGEGFIEVEASGAGSKIRVLVRTDTSPNWSLWHEEDTSAGDESELHGISLGQPPRHCREASWFQFKIEGLGYAKLRLLEADIVENRTKMGKAISTHNVTSDGEAYYKYNKSPHQERWS